MEKEQIQSINKVPEYDIIRLIGTILVVMGHSAYTTMITQTGGIVIDVSYGHMQEIILLFVRLVYSFHMPMFIALSGALFYLTGTYKLGFLRMIKGKANRLLIPFIITSFFWSIPLKAISGYWQQSEEPIKDIIIGQFVRFDNNHLWYLISLLLVFLCFYSLIKYQINPLIIGFVCICFFVISQLFSYNYFGIQKAMMYSVWFGGGILYEANRTYIKRFMQHLSSQIIFIFTTVCVYYIYLRYCKNNEFVYSMLAFFGMGAVYILALYLEKTKLLCIKGIKKILQYSFEIYLISDPINYLFLALIRDTGIKDFYKSNVFCVIVYIFRIIATIVIAILIAVILKKVKIWRKTHATSK